jgi:hypothetical protein
MIIFSIDSPDSSPPDIRSGRTGISTINTYNAKHFRACAQIKIDLRQVRYET